VICKLCKQDKNVLEFYFYIRNGKEYRRTTCRVCLVSIKRKRYKEDLEYRNKLKGQSLKYAHSKIGREKRRANRLKRAKTPKFKEYQRKWLLTEKGIRSRRGRVNRFSKTEKGFAANKRRHARRRSRFSDVVVNLTAIEWNEILKKFDNKCAYCGLSFTKEIPPTQDHKIPISKGGNHTKDNIVPSCKSCNSKKKDKIWLK